MSFNLNNIPIFNDIETRHLWIIPAAVGGAYFLPKVLKKIFPLPNVPVSEASFRSKLAYIHHYQIRNSEPQLYEFIHIHIQDNLHIAILIVAITVLKRMNMDLREPMIIGSLIFALCPFLTCTRGLSSFFLRKIYENLPKNNSLTTTIGTICHKISIVIAPSTI